MLLQITLPSHNELETSYSNYLIDPRRARRHHPRRPARSAVRSKQLRHPAVCLRRDRAPASSASRHRRLRRWL